MQWRLTSLGEALVALPTMYLAGGAPALSRL